MLSVDFTSLLWPSLAEDEQDFAREDDIQTDLVAARKGSDVTGVETELLSAGGEGGSLEIGLALALGGLSAYPVPSVSEGRSPKSFR